MRKKAAIILVLCIIFAIAIATSAVSAKAGKVEICHLLKTGDYTKITVNTKTLDRLLAHGDLYPFDPIPDMDGWALDGDCIPYEVVPVFTGGLPYAYPCEPPLPGTPGPLDDLDCAVVYGDVDQNIDEVIGPSEPNWDELVLLVMDQPSFCEEIGGIGTDFCDIDGDTVADIIFQSSDSRFLALDGIPSAAQLDDLISGNLSVQIYPYTWAAGVPGVITSIFLNIKASHESTIVPVLVTDFECFGTSPDVDCPDLFNLGNSDPPDKIIYAQGIYNYYRIIGWRNFFVSCVKESPASQCPFNQMLRDYGVLEANVITVEGYFVDN